MTHRLRNASLNALLLAVTLVVAVAGVELALRVFYPTSDRYYVLEPDQSVTLTPLEEHVPGVERAARYRTSSWGIRGPEFSDEDDYRILAIGGSTTQNAYLDQSVTWTLLTADDLNQARPTVRTWTGDIGRSGHTARSHVLQLRHVVPDLPTIDAVVLLVGVNDLTVALRQGFSYVPPPPLTDPDARELQMRQAFLSVPGGLHERFTSYQAADVPFWKQLAIYQLAREVRNGLVQARGGTRQDRFGEAYVVWRQHRESASRLHDTLPDLALPLAEYRGYLTEMVRDAEAMGVRVIFLTQPVLWRDDLSEDEEALLWLGGIGDFQLEPGHEYFTPGALRRAMDAYNTTVLDVCRDLEAECLDLASAVPSSTTMFYDDVHFTEEGSRRVAGLLVDYLLRHPPYATGN